MNLATIALALIHACAAAPPTSTPTRGPVDLALTYRSDIDGTIQPYRLYLPSAYDGTRRLPLFIAMHGTGGDQNKYFDHPTYGDGIYKRQAEKRGIAVVCPHGRGTTEFRGIGENDVLTVLQEVCKRFRIDEDRIICSGQSMGGTGTTYLCCRYPDLFAAGAPLASTYGHIALVENLRHVPMLYVQGAKDWPIYAKDGPIPITKRMSELGYAGRLWMIPDVQHNTMAVSTEAVLDWALQQRRVTHPKRVTFRAYLPIHGKAYWTEIQDIDEIGPFAEIDAQIKPGNAIAATIKNARRVALRPDPALLDLTKPIRVTVSGKQVFTGPCSHQQEISLTKSNGHWQAAAVPRNPRPPTAYRTHKIGKVITAPTQAGKAETSMGTWMADMIRDAAGADVAIYNRRYYRGVPFRDGQDVYIVDLLNWIRPCNRCLSTFTITGKDLLEIIEDNIRDDPKQAEFLLQVSGCRYAFDRNRAKGQRTVETDILPDKSYTVACENQVLSRGDTCFLAGRFDKIPYENLVITNITGAWRYIHKQGGKLDGHTDGRVRDLTPGTTSRPRL
ncbi:MAG: 5'-nucleotidase C-terminal domain-containing protein [Phycisphaerae bacterium]|nr:5'-nucleotidase C-terminal domain-containing protein [Phycisphaerae bacterium]